MEKMEPINCMLAKVLGGSFASMPSNALDNDSTKRSIKDSSLLLSSSFTVEDDREVRNKARPAYATDVTADFSWCVAVI